MKKIQWFIDVPLSLLVYPSAALLKKIRRTGISRLPYCRNALMKSRVFPICDHYYEPQFDFRDKISVIEGQDPLRNRLEHSGATENS